MKICKFVYFVNYKISCLIFRIDIYVFIIIIEYRQVSGTTVRNTRCEYRLEWKDISFFFRQINWLESVKEHDPL